MAAAGGPVLDKPYTEERLAAALDRVLTASREANEADARTAAGSTAHGGALPAWHEVKWLLSVRMPVGAVCLVWGRRRTTC